MRYFFNLFEDVPIMDEEGGEFATLALARAAALDTARALIGAAVSETGRINLDHRIDIVTDQRERVGRVVFRDAFVVVDRRGKPFRFPTDAE